MTTVQEKAPTPVLLLKPNEPCRAESAELGQALSLLEEAADETMRPYLDPGQDSVGVRVDVRHLAATPKGMRVRATATVREVDRRRVTFDVVIEDEVEKVGEATHDRFVIDADRYTDRLKQKAAKV